MTFSANTAGFVALIGVAGLLIYNGVNNPVSAHREWLQRELSGLSPDWEQKTASDVNLQELTGVITSKGVLWDRLVAPPPPPKQQVDVLKLLEGVTVTRQVMGSGKDLQIKLITPSEPRGKWFRAGDQINGATLLEINGNALVFGVGEYRGALSR